MKITDFPLILDVLTHAPDTGGGVALRRLLWSLRGSEVGTDGRIPAVRLWTAVGELGCALRTEFACLITQDLETQAELTRALFEKSGEWDRIDDHPLPVLD